ncbi:SDR family oxidoreductase [Lentzea sp. NPDC051838]|uniref:SDR family oxidoreductase n=1 Tax=Lentzea sp. NPDC051838 TaxID=3154849 RepID=UPI00341D0236
MRILLTGAGGVVGSEVAALLRTLPLTEVTRRPAPGQVRWHIGTDAPPADLRGHWDVIIHAAASTRWTMSTDEAMAANVRPTEAVLDLADADTHLVHVSTAYVDGWRDADAREFSGYRNGYEWSKSVCEDLVRARHPGPLTIVRPPLILGSRATGAISRFSGPYTLLQTLVSGLAAAVVGDPDGFAEVAPVDQVAEVIAAAATGSAPRESAVLTIAGGENCMRLSTLLDVACGTLNEWRTERGLEKITVPPFIATRRWHRFFLPLAKEHLSEVQHRAVELLGMFESYTSMATPFEPTHQVVDPAGLLERSVRWWADAKPRLAAKAPAQWAVVPG